MVRAILFHSGPVSTAPLAPAEVEKGLCAFLITVCCNVPSVEPLKNPTRTGARLASSVRQIIVDGQATTGQCSPPARPTRFFRSELQMPARDPVQTELTYLITAETEPGLFRAMQSQLLAQAREVSQSICTRVTAVLKPYLEHDSRLHQAASRSEDRGSAG